MAWLVIQKGANQGQVRALDQERTTLGRSVACHITIPGTAVSRQHAHILQSQGKHYIEDLGSRNKTFVNDKELTPRTQLLLRNRDRIKICDFLCSFHTTTPAARDRPAPSSLEPEKPEGGSESTLYESSNPSSQGLYLDQSPDNLRRILETSNRLSKTLEMDLLLPKIGDCLFQLFRQVDRCLIAFREGVDQVVPKMVKARPPQDENDLRLSRTIVQRCLESKQAFLTYDAATDDRVPSKSVSDLRLRSVMCVPLCTAGGEAFGVIQLETQDSAKKFTPEDLKLLSGVAYQASIALENARLYEQLLAREQVERDLELAGQMQRSILPDQLPELAGYQFFAHYAAAHEVGGDYYDFIPLPQERLAVTVGDVVGKGISAALLMAKLSSDVRFCLQTEAEPSVAVARLNDLIYKHTNLTERFITLLAAVLDPARETATLVNAGNVLPLLYRHASGEVREAIPRETAGLPLGVQRGQGYSSCDVKLEPGDCVLLYTDGVSDAVDVHGRPFQVEGVRRVLRHGPFASPEALGRKVIRAIERHATGRSQYDDITLVCFGRTLA